MPSNKARAAKKALKAAPLTNFTEHNIPLDLRIGALLVAEYLNKTLADVLVTNHAYASAPEAINAGFRELSASRSMDVKEANDNYLCRHVLPDIAVDLERQLTANYGPYIASVDPNELTKRFTVGATSGGKLKVRVVAWYDAATLSVGVSAKVLVLFNKQR